MIRNVLLILYYSILQFIPMQPMPGYKLGYWLRRKVCKHLLRKCGDGVIIKDHCDFGNGMRLSVGHRSQLGKNSKLAGTITIGDDVLMGPDVVMMSMSHGYESIGVPINRQPGWEKPIIIGNDVWVGTRVIILPGVTIGNHCIIGSGAVVTKSFPDNCILGGVPARCLKMRSI